MLNPHEPEIDCDAALVVYVTATLHGFISQETGKLGLFETTALVVLPQFAKVALLAALLVFRCLSFVLPLAFAASMMIYPEIWLAGRFRAIALSND
jgi:uncharacterized membrane protein YbhN (UPF0104 family)